MIEVKEILPRLYFFLARAFILFCIERLQGGNLFVARWNTSKTIYPSYQNKIKK